VIRTCAQWRFSIQKPRSTRVETQIDMVIVDHIMPKVDGHHIHPPDAGDGGHGQDPMVMLTATTEDAVRLAALEAGATDFLSKSQSQWKLKVRLRNLIKLSDALRKLDDHVAEQAREIEKATQASRARRGDGVPPVEGARIPRQRHQRSYVPGGEVQPHESPPRLGLSRQECDSIYLAFAASRHRKGGDPRRDLLKTGPSRRTTNGPIVETVSPRSASESFAAARGSDQVGAQIAGASRAMDGKGYPRGLSARPFRSPRASSRSPTSFDALTTERPYKRRFRSPSALAILEPNAAATSIRLPRRIPFGYAETTVRRFSRVERARFRVYGGGCA